MTSPFRNLSRLVLVFVLSLGLASPQALLAEQPSVTASELRAAVRMASSTRQRDLNQVRSFFGDPRVERVLADARIDAGRVQMALSAMDAGELAKLSARTTRIQTDFAAGTMTNQELTYIVIALAAAVVVLIAVAA